MLLIFVASHGVILDCTSDYNNFSFDCHGGLASDRLLSGSDQSKVVKTETEVCTLLKEHEE